MALRVLLSSPRPSRWAIPHWSFSFISISGVWIIIVFFVVVVSFCFFRQVSFKGVQNPFTIGSVALSLLQRQAYYILAFGG